MRILIIGVTGMFGSALHQVFHADPRFETWGTLRDEGARRHFPADAYAHLPSGVDVRQDEGLMAVMERVRPDVVVNAVGIVKQLAAADDPLVAIPINALYPHRLAALCGQARARLIHVSTDCVFSGRTGPYVEDDPSDASDMYGQSKYLGEVRHQSHVITLRTSGIGHELATRLGLVEWFMGAGQSVRGFSHAIYSGLPWVELACVIRDHVLPRADLHGLYHVSSDAISKLDLLRLIAHTYGRAVEIVPDDSVRINRALDSSRFRAATSWVPAPWPELVAKMHAMHVASTADAH